MNREIKFRAFDKVNKYMMDIFDNDNDDWFLPSWKNTHEVMQYTGLKDSKEKEIYEGDIVEIETYSYEEPENSYKGVVHISVYGFSVLGEDDMGTKDYYNLLEIEGSYLTEIEVVGNIYENPELLEGESND